MAKAKKKTVKVEDDMSKKKAEEKMDIPASNGNDPETEKTEEQTVDPMVEMQNALDQLNDKYLRLNAEYQNYRKRVEKEKSDIFKYGHEKFIMEMLPIMDNFERALAASVSDEAATVENKVLDGIKMIKKGLDELFAKHHVNKIEALGQPFDPIKHHAVMTVEAEDGESDHVIEVFQEGYLLNDKVIRPSMVKVTHS
jgi:molecular chaperone GrpE